MTPGEWSLSLLSSLGIVTLEQEGDIFHIEVENQDGTVVQDCGGSPSEAAMHALESLAREGARTVKPTQRSLTLPNGTFVFLEDDALSDQSLAELLHQFLPERVTPEDVAKVVRKDIDDERLDILHWVFSAIVCDVNGTEPTTVETLRRHIYGGVYKDGVQVDPQTRRPLSEAEISAYRTLVRQGWRQQNGPQSTDN